MQVSDNIERHLGLAPAAALGRTLADVLGAEAAGVLAPELPGAGERPSFAATVRLANKAFDVLVHRHDALLMLEFEAVQRAGAADFRHLYPLVGNFLQQLDDTDSVESMGAMAADQIRAVTGFNRVLVYKFDAEGHGHVFAESNDGVLPACLGQRFPASDIPRQARELYAANRIRLIHDANYAPARLVPPDNPLTGTPNDLSFAALRSVSPANTGLGKTSLS